MADYPMNSELSVIVRNSQFCTGVYLVHLAEIGLKRAGPQFEMLSSKTINYM